MTMKTAQDHTTNGIRILNVFSSFTLHCFTRGVIQSLIKAKFDWVKLLDQILTIIVQYYKKTQSKAFGGLQCSTGT
jgi:hypothetical protein